MTSVPRILHSGTALTLYAVVDEGGVCDAEIWLAGLPVAPQTQFKARFERLTVHGRLGGYDQMHQLECPGEPPVTEIKVHHGPGYRLYVIREGRDWVATHGCKKPKDKKVCTEATRARNIFNMSYEGRSK